VAHSHAGYDLAFTALGAFEGTAFSTEAVGDVCAFDSVDQARAFLVELRRRLCVRQAHGFYSLHPFVAETARSAQAAHADDIDVSAPARRHADYYDGLLQRHGGYEWNIGRYPSLVPEERELVHAIDAAASLADAAGQDEGDDVRLQCARMTSFISWYLYWRGHWDLRIRLCARVCRWAEQGLLARTYPNPAGIVGNLYVDQGWTHLTRGSLDEAERCAVQGQDWLSKTGDQIFATELAAQVAMARRDYPLAIRTFEGLRGQVDEGTRYWLVFSYRLADALQASGDPAAALTILEELLARIDPDGTGGELDDVHARLLYRAAVRRHEAGGLDDAISFARRSTAAFARSGIIAPERRAAVILLADLLGQSGAAEECRQVLLAAKQEAEQEGDFEMLMEIGKRVGNEQPPPGDPIAMGKGSDEVLSREFPGCQPCRKKSLES
jgi:tetratricopeptide (TPR) repeat protein